jgi:hypothetical protein
MTAQDIAAGAPFASGSGAWQPIGNQGGLIEPWTAAPPTAACADLELWQAAAVARPGGPILILTAARILERDWRGTVEFLQRSGTWTYSPLPNLAAAQQWAERQIEIIGDAT